MDQRIRDILEPTEMTPLHVALLTHCEDLLTYSRRSMAVQYPYWDKQADIYMRRLPANKDDAEAVKQGLPRRIVVPMSYSQINTFVAAGVMQLTQRERFFELSPVEGQDDGMRECCEMVLQRDQDATAYKTRLVNNLLNVARFGMGVEVDWWDVETAYIPVQEPGAPQQTMNGIPVNDPPPITKLKKVTKREGNCIRTISPYRVFLDAGFHWSQWQRGNFVAWDDEFSRNALTGLEQDGVIVGVKDIPQFTMNRWVEVGRGHGANDSWTRFTGIKSDALEKASTVCITQMVINLIPANIKADGRALGEEKFPHKWLIWIANDQRIVRAEPLPNAHAQWPVSISLFSPDMHEIIYNCLAYMIDDLQSLVSWLMNSRMAAVSRTIDNQFVVDPLGISIEDVAMRKRMIRMTKAGSGKDVRRFISQLQVTDTTQGHVADMTNLISMLQMVTGVNDNAMGQYNGGRRSATESRVVTQGAAARMKMVFDCIWHSHYVPQANRCLINARQEMSYEEFASIVGPEAAQKYYGQFHAPVEQLARSYDYIPFDGTQPSEKQFIAQQLMEVLSLLLSNPQQAIAFNMDPQKVFGAILELRGIHATAYNFPPEVLAQVSQQMQMQQQMAQMPVEGGPSA